MDRGQAHIQRQQRGQSFCKRGRQQRCHRFAVADRLHQDGSGGRGRVGRRLRTVTSRQACEHRWDARRSEAVACDSGSCGRKRCRRRMRHAIVATKSQICQSRFLSRFVSYMFCTFISQYMLDVEFGIEKRRGYIYIYMPIL